MLIFTLTEVERSAVIDALNLAIDGLDDTDERLKPLLRVSELLQD